MKRRVFISVYDKEGIIDFAKDLAERFDYEIVSYGETYNLLKSAGIEVVNLSEYSKFSGFLKNDYEIINETFLSSVVANSSDMAELSKTEKSVIKPFDMVVVNLYPIENLISESSNPDEIINNIDIPSITLLRVAAKNYKNVTVVTDKHDYDAALNANEFDRLKFAAKAYNITSNYDRLICSTLAEQTDDKQFKIFNFEKLNDLPYGENPHQKSSLYKTDKMIDYEVLNGKVLTFNNIIDVTAAVNVISEFYDVNGVAIIRHGKPCGVALGCSLYEAYTKAFDCDPISSFYGVVGFSKKVDLEVAKHLNSMSFEVVVAPDFDEKAVELFKDNAEIKLIKLNTSLKEYRRLTMEEVIMTPFGALVQDRNNSELDKDMFKVVTKEKPTPEQIEDAIFAWKVVKYAKTNSVVIAKDLKTSAIAQGYTNEFSAIEWALNYACDNSKEAILASDSAIQSEDSIYSAIQARISLIIQPGGSAKDQQLIDICDKYGIAMITTGIRNYML